MPALSVALTALPVLLGASLASAEASFHAGVASGDPAAARKHFIAAGNDFDQLLAHRHQQSPALYRNLGNARFLAGQLPQALAAFRQGLLLAPDDAVLRKNLEFARSRVEYPPGARPPANVWPKWLFANLLLGAALLAHALGWLAWTKRRHGWMWFAFALAALLAIAWGVKKVHDLRSDTFVVIAKDDVPLRRGNGDEYPTPPDAPTLARGMEARLLSRRGDWLQIRLCSGQVGWVQNRTALVEWKAEH
ncbi:MAG: hypothetical protein FJ271_27140 [Planctomycetes bacterium]|nr:hypothetical protein [Planctomycetota bacterium]